MEYFEGIQTISFTIKMFSTFLSILSFHMFALNCGIRAERENVTASSIKPEKHKSVWGSTSLERHKSSPYLKLKNRNSKCQVFFSTVLKKPKSWTGMARPVGIF